MKSKLLFFVITLLFVSGCSHRNFTARRYNRERIIVEAVKPEKKITPELHTPVTTTEDSSSAALFPVKENAKGEVNFFKETQEKNSSSAPDATTLKQPVREKTLRSDIDIPVHESGKRYIPEQPVKTNQSMGAGMGIASLVLALTAIIFLIGLLFVSFWLFWILGIILALIAVILGAVGLTQGRGISLAGLILGSIALLIYILLLILVLALVILVL